MPEEKHEHAHRPVTLPPAAQQAILQLQTFQQQANALALQRESLTIQKIELERALEELKKASDKEDVFKAVGPVLIKSTKAALIKELTEKKDTADVRLKSVEKQDAKIHEKIKEIQEKLGEMLKA
ncbi:MAG: prefoldin subunit beta [Candidatus Aenigmatarchaeota archaeon]|nr:prefoldin subunit beta [Candidatus Aenigmarchaeota archaeon]